MPGVFFDENRVQIIHGFQHVANQLRTQYNRSGIAHSLQFECYVTLNNIPNIEITRIMMTFGHVQLRKLLDLVRNYVPEPYDIQMSYVLKNHFPDLCWKIVESFLINFRDGKENVEFHFA